MDHKISAVERAFQMAKAGQAISLDEIKRLEEGRL
jgi:hypothetical protein